MRSSRRARRPRISFAACCTRLRPLLHRAAEMQCAADARAAPARPIASRRAVRVPLPLATAPIVVVRAGSLRVARVAARGDWECSAFRRSPSTSVLQPALGARRGVVRRLGRSDAIPYTADAPLQALLVLGRSAG